MKVTQTKDDVVVPIPSGRNVESRSPTHGLAMQIGELRMLSEKLLYRVQQCERREKSLLDANRSLRRELTALKRQIGRPAPKRAPRPAPDLPPSPPPPDHLPPNYDNDPTRTAPNFSAALPGLNRDRY